ncbi:MAG TPA: DNA (cytosine-5-)-methyltransferase [Methylomirabilota bacterium]|nr:DNA (cytosine-5-)-methyltransferase [Methylomirabilota bacterium]
MNGEITIKYIDLFCGLGGFRLAIEAAARELGGTAECVFSSDIDEECRRVYAANFSETPHGDITKVEAEAVPAHDILLAGFPCQPFSIIGKGLGFEDTRGTLFFDIARILEAKRPAMFVLENVRLLVKHDGGRTMGRILETLREMGYQTDFRVLNALDFGLPQKRDRVFIVGFREPARFQWPAGGIPMKPLAELLERDVPRKFYASEKIQKTRLKQESRTSEPTIWHENVSGNVRARPYSCALRAGASYNYLLVNGERRLTPREMLRLQGFPEWYKIACGDYETRKQAGNSVAVPVVQAVVRETLKAGVKMLRSEPVRSAA